MLINGIGVGVGFDKRRISRVLNTMAAREVGSDSFSGAAAVLVAAALAVQESGQDTLAVTGEALIQAAMTAAESGADVASFLGTVTGGGGGGSAILDTLSTSATVAVSDRELTGTSWGTIDTVTDPVRRLRRDSDDAERSFTATELVDGTFATWVGAASAYTVKRYDQTGNGNHWTQAVAAEQPLFTLSDAAFNNKPTDTGAGLGDGIGLEGVDLSALTAGHVFMVQAAASDPGSGATGTGTQFNFGSAGTSNHYPFTDGSVYDDLGFTDRPNVGNPTTDLASAHVLDVIATSSKRRYNWNGTTDNKTPAVGTVGFASNCTIGDSTPYDWQGYFADVIVFPSELSAADASALRSDLGTEFGITIS